jgi:hypothetical protein
MIRTCELEAIIEQAQKEALEFAASKVPPVSVVFY